MKLAVTTLFEFMTIVTDALSPEALPSQLLNTYPEAGVAVSVTDVLYLKCTVIVLEVFSPELKLTEPMLGGFTEIARVN